METATYIDNIYKLYAVPVLRSKPIYFPKNVNLFILPYIWPMTSIL